MQIQRYLIMNILSKVSPFLKNLNEGSSNLLIILLDLFSTYDFLLQAKDHPYCLLKLVEVLENIIGF